MCMEDEHTAEYWFELGKYHSSLKNARSAINCYQRAVELDPNYYQAWYNMAAELFQLKDYSKAIDACKKTIKIKQDDFNAWLTIAASYFQLNDDGRALFCFRMASELGSTKARKFLENARNVNDKMMNSKPIDILPQIADITEPNSKKQKQFLHAPKAGSVTTEHAKFIEELSGSLLQLGKKLQNDTGGVISFLELFSRLKQDEPDFTGTPADVLEALHYLENNNLIVGVKKLIDSNFTVVEFVPVDFTPDIHYLLKLASESGILTIDEIAMTTSWDEFRINRALDVLEQKGVARKITTYKDGIRWCFPGLNLKCIDELEKK